MQAKKSTLIFKKTLVWIKCQNSTKFSTKCTKYYNFVIYFCWQMHKNSGFKDSGQSFCIKLNYCFAIWSIYIENNFNTPSVNHGKKNI